MRQQPPNARFWVWWNDGWVKLTLRPNEELTLFTGGATDEGWSSTAESYSHEGDHVLFQGTTDGSDCDGRLTQCIDSMCPLDLLKARCMATEWTDWDYTLDRPMPRNENYGIFAPAWQRLGSSQRDYSAEAMGY